MDAFADSAQRMINSLVDMMHRYENACGKAPEVLLVSKRAYWMLEKYARDFYLRHSASGPIAYFRGIEVRIGSDENEDIYMGGEPITLRE